MPSSCLCNPLSSCWFSTNLHYSAVTFQINIIQSAAYNCVWAQQKLKHHITQDCLQYKFKIYQLLWKKINYILAKTSTDGNSANRSSVSLGGHKFFSGALFHVHSTAILYPSSKGKQSYFKNFSSWKGYTSLDLLWR